LQAVSQLVSRALGTESLAEEARGLRQAAARCREVCQAFHMETYRLHGLLLSAHIVAGRQCCACCACFVRMIAYHAADLIVIVIVRC
jgi:hypothetical protein